MWSCVQCSWQSWANATREIPEGRDVRGVWICGFGVEWLASVEGREHAGVKLDVLLIAVFNAQGNVRQDGYDATRACVCL